MACLEFVPVDVNRFAVCFPLEEVFVRLIILTGAELPYQRPTKPQLLVRYTFCVSLRVGCFASRHKFLLNVVRVYRLARACASRRVSSPVEREG
ncbi:hypothetical protein ACXR0O_04920 [Verrucomicrobiota bacterium sgz303538]